MEKACSGEPERALAPRSVAFVTLGCAKNEVDTAAHARPRPGGGLCGGGRPCLRRRRGRQHLLVHPGGHRGEPRGNLRRRRACPNVESGRAALVVAGCMPARYGADLEAELSEAGAFVPCAREDDLAAVLEGLFAKLPARDEASASCTGTDAAGDESGEGACAGGRRHRSEGLAGAAGVQQAEAEARLGLREDIGRVRPLLLVLHHPLHPRALPQLSLGATCAPRWTRTWRAACAEIVLIAQDTGRWGADFEEPLDAWPRW